MAGAINTGIVCGAPTENGTPCQIQVRRQGQRCRKHPNIVLAEEMEQHPNDDIEHIPELEEYFEQVEAISANDNTIDTEISFLLIHLQHLRREYETHIKANEHTIAQSRLAEMVKLASTKAKLLEQNNQLKVMSGKLLPVEKFEEALTDFMQILQKHLMTYPDILMRIKNDIYGLTEETEEANQAEDVFNDFLGMLNEQ